jgi:glutaminyl-tRNA synthetase
MNAANPQMWDVVAYRIKYTAHPHVGNKWCIYPSYDYTHCINDSLENISYSLCTLEFEVRRESYYWLLDELDLYKPKVWEYSRLNLDYNVLSKRRLLRLVEEKWVRGWDDPRLLTLNGLRRRGYTAEAINAFCKLVGVTRSTNNQPMTLLEHCVREALDPVSNRALVIEHPLKVILTNFPSESKDGKVEERDAPNHPLDPSKGTHKVPLTRVIYIEQSDFREQDSKDYFGLAPNKQVRLRYAYNITCTKVERNPDGSISHLLATVDFKSDHLPAGKITWVAEPRPGQTPLRVELRQYELLFLSKEPMKAVETRNLSDWIEDINPKSLTVVHGYADPSVAKAKPGDRFQFERMGYYVCDPDSRPEQLVFNRTCKLKEKAKPKA